MGDDMYNYTIYEKVNGAQNILEYICGAGSETLSETEYAANKRLLEVRGHHPDPSSVFMERKIIVFK